MKWRKFLKVSDRGRNILITGHKGFLGKHLVAKLGMENILIGVSNNISSAVEKISEYKPDSISEIKQQPEIIVMCHAAVSSGATKATTEQLYKSNVSFTKDLVNRFSESYFIFISTVSVYGIRQETLNENSIVTPESEYAISKLWGEQIVSTAKAYGILRLSSLYGEHMKENTIIPNYVNQALKNQEIEIWGDGRRLQNYLHVKDAVSYIKKMAEQKSQGVHIAASSKEISNHQLAAKVAKYTGSKIKFKSEDNSASITIDNKATKEKLNIEDEINFDLGIKEYINWKQKQS